MRPLAVSVASRRCRSCSPATAERRRETIPPFDLHRRTASAEWIVHGRLDAKGRLIVDATLKGKAAAKQLVLTNGPYVFARIEQVGEGGDFHRGGGLPASSPAGNGRSSRVTTAWSASWATASASSAEDPARPREDRGRDGPAPHADARGVPEERPRRRGGPRAPEACSSACRLPPTAWARSSPSG